MYIIRPSRPDDLDILLKLARMVHFINLPADKDIIAEKIARSRHSFRAATIGQGMEVGAADRSATHGSPLFMFSIADADTDIAVGTCMIIAKMGMPGYPNVSFELHKKEFFSKDLQSGATHIVARLHLDESGKTEIGGLILGPSLRGHADRLGKQLSLIRFHYMGLRREQFSDRILAEMMAPITPDGRNVFWENCGRRFINLPYVEADKFCQYSREFMTSLLPRDDIYLTLLPPEARQGIAQVGRETVPARRMLEALGFKYVGRIDPFDGGPHLECRTDEISLVRHTARHPLVGTCNASDADTPGFVSVEGDGIELRAVHGRYRITSDGIELPGKIMKLLRAEKGVSIGVTPIDLAKPMRPADAMPSQIDAPDARTSAEEAPRK